MKVNAQLYAPASKSEPSVIQHVASCCTDCATWPPFNGRIINEQKFGKDMEGRFHGLI
jgi:epoxyqueuosine reductase QueG